VLSSETCTHSRHWLCGKLSHAFGATVCPMDLLNGTPETKMLLSRRRMKVAVGSYPPFLPGLGSSLFPFEGSQKSDMHDCAQTNLRKSNDTCIQRMPLKPHATPKYKAPWSVHLFCKVARVLLCPLQHHTLVDVVTSHWFGKPMIAHKRVPKAQTPRGSPCDQLSCTNLSW
jgi:hypothetical protein